MTVSVTGSPFQVQVWRSGSMRSWPRSSTLAASASFGAAPSLGAARRSTALTRSTSRRCENGLRMKSSAPILRPNNLVDLLVLGGEEDHRHVGLLAQPAQQLHAVHARHLDVEDGEIGRRGLKPSSAEAPSV